MRPATGSARTSQSPIGHLGGFSTPVMYWRRTLAPATGFPLPTSTTRPRTTAPSPVSGDSAPGDWLCASAPVNIATTKATEAIAIHIGGTGLLTDEIPSSL